MGKIEVVSASAGSGKTTRVAGELRRRIQEGTARPEAVVATTFTNKAADELKERARTELFRAGLNDEALRLEAARIGTVNSVCGRLVSDFAFELGLSPELRVIDEDQARVALRRVISLVVTESEREELAVLGRRLNDFSWQRDVERLLTLARTNLLTVTQLKTSGRRSEEQLVAHLPSPDGDAEGRDLAFRDALEAALVGVDPSDETAATRGAVSRIHEALAPLRVGPAPWSAWAKVKAVKPGKKSEPAFVRAKELAVEVDSHPRLRADLSRAIQLVFDLVVRTLTHWQDEKAALGVVDFVDQETLALEVLMNPAFAARLSSQLDLVLVDEFQDTSPLQLRLFTRLAELAKASVWVGDQKQAIFGFRGTDPALMDAAIDSVLGGKEPETLRESFRSRAPLVELTSNLFAKAFAGHGLPEQRVRLTARAGDDARLGSPLVQWKLVGKNREQYLSALAQGVVGLLNDESVLVRDRVDGALRRARAGDVAVLCRKNADGQALARLLAGRGLAATVKRTGLLLTPEARAAVLALRLFIDERDHLAAGELARLLLHPDDPEGWLCRALTRPDGQPHFAGAAFHEGIAQARTGRPVAGPLAALDAAMEGIGLWGLLPRWGDSARRLANLDALRGHAVDYVSRADADGSAATPAGLLAWFEVLEAEALDSQARLPGADAVVISTWHAAKGLEWPVTVLALVGGERPLARFGFAVRTTAQAFSLEDPLEGRWVRYWPNPFHPSQTTELRARLERAPDAQREQDESNKQELRLLYVGWTRARDRLVLARADGEWMVEGLEVPSGECVAIEASEVEPATPRADEAVATSGPREHPAAYASASTLEGRALGTPEVFTLGERLLITGEVDMANFGQAVHGFLAVDRVTAAKALRTQWARQSLEQWGESGAIRAEQLLERSEALAKWADRVAPGARWHRELPLEHALPGGTVVRGVADLVLETAAGFWIIDHKSFPGEDAVGLERARKHGGQLEAYAAALSAAWNKPCLGRVIHLAVLGKVVHWV